MTHLSWKIFFSYKPLLLLSSAYWSHSLCKVLKNSSCGGSRVMKMYNFWAQNGPFPQMRIFSKTLLMSLVSFIHAYLHAKNQSQILIFGKMLMIKIYWNLIAQKPFLAITSEIDLPQACSFCRMLIDHSDVHFPQIPEKLMTWLS